MLRKLVLVIAVLVVAAVAALWWYTRPLPILTVTTWAGPYGRAQAAALMRPYAAATRVDVHIAQWDGDLGDVEAAVTNHAYKGDVIDFELPKAVEACRRGLLEKIDAASLPPGADGTPAANDFVKGAIGPCWVGSVVYSQVILVAPHVFAGAQPETLADFFDTAKFPGRRALGRASPKFNLEMALLADGVAPADIYQTLDTPAGVDRAFARLKALGPIWAHDSSDAILWLKNGQAVMATALNGDFYDQSRHGFQPGVIWDREMYELDVFGVPKDDPKKDMAMDFIRHATASATLAGVADWVALGPARRSSMPLVGDNPELKIPMTQWLPTAHFATAFAVDDGWWNSHEAALLPRWQAFVMSTE